MMANRRYIEDGFLVVGDISESGCISYTHQDREVVTSGERIEEDWKTHKIVLSADEQRRMSTTKRLLVRNISKLGSTISNYGIFIPKYRANELEAAILVAERGVSDFNAEAKYTRLRINFAVFEIAGSDERIARALYGDTVQMIEGINAAIEAGDVKKLRYLVTRMKEYGKVLPEATSKKLSDQIEEAKKAAKEAMKASGEAGTEKKKIEKAVEALQAARMDGLRASLVESIGQMDKAPGTNVPGVDITVVRQIESEIIEDNNREKKAEKEPKSKPKAKRTKRDIE